mmetsp:Transcript_18551/g.52115  ORF Transcript_18551/g.52115 Transcript_18551/m.52115 type:complete len:231 (-) Transcript_18551:212-904(-)
MSSSNEVLRPAQAWGPMDGGHASWGGQLQATSFLPGHVRMHILHDHSFICCAHDQRGWHPGAVATPGHAGTSGPALCSGGCNLELAHKRPAVGCQWPACFPNPHAAVVRRSRQQEPMLARSKGYVPDGRYTTLEGGILLPLLVLVSQVLLLELHCALLLAWLGGLPWPRRLPHTHSASLRSSCQEGAALWMGPCKRGDGMGHLNYAFHHPVGSGYIRHPDLHEGAALWHG